MLYGNIEVQQQKGFLFFFGPFIFYLKSLYHSWLVNWNDGFNFFLFLVNERAKQCFYFLVLWFMGHCFYCRLWQKKSRQDMRKQLSKSLIWYVGKECVAWNFNISRLGLTWVLLCWLQFGLGWLCYGWRAIWRKTEERDVGVFHGSNVRQFLLLAIYLHMKLYLVFW